MDKVNNQGCSWRLFWGAFLLGIILLGYMMRLPLNELELDHNKIVDKVLSGETTTSFYYYRQYKDASPWVFYNPTIGKLIMIVGIIGLTAIITKAVVPIVRARQKEEEKRNTLQLPSEISINVRNQLNDIYKSEKDKNIQQIIKKNIEDSMQVYGCLSRIIVVNNLEHLFYYEKGPYLVCHKLSNKYSGENIHILKSYEVTNNRIRAKFHKGGARDLYFKYNENIPATVEILDTILASKDR